MNRRLALVLSPWAFALALSSSPRPARAGAGPVQFVAAQEGGGAKETDQEKEKEREREREREREDEARGKARKPAESGPDDIFYALGALRGTQLRALGLTARELEQVKKGFADAAGGKKLRLKEPDLEEWGSKVDAYLANRTTPGAEAERKRGRAFEATALKEPGAVKTPSGLIYRTLTPGTGASPTLGSVAKVTYVSKHIDGKEFDSNVGKPAVDVPIRQVIPCWKEGLQRMKVGEKARLVCPDKLAFGLQGQPPNVSPGATLVYDIELVSVR